MRIPGVGKKTAERMVLELRDKLDCSAHRRARRRAAAKSAFSATEEDVISALMNFGVDAGGGGSGGDEGAVGEGRERIRCAVPRALKLVR